MSDPKNAIGEALSLPKLKLGQAVKNSEIRAGKHRFGPDNKQYFLYFKPSGAVKRRIIVYIHGGGWMAGSPNRYKYIGKVFSDMGYHTVSLGYRHTPLYKYPAQAEDIFTAYVKAIAFLQKNGVRTDRVVVIGSSAGGHLGGILVYDKQMQQKYDINPNVFKGLVSLGGILSFGVEYAPTTQLLIESLFEKGYDRKKAEPMSLVDGSEKVKVLCIHAQNDPVSEIENEAKFVAHANALRPKSADSMIITDENVYHSNLVMGVFFDDPEKSEPLKVLFRWVESLAD